MHTHRAAKNTFTQRSRDAMTVTWKTHHFTLEHYKVSKSEIVKNVIAVADF